MIGYYIVEFEQKGEDRAKYGVKLLKELTIKLKNRSGKTNERASRNIRNFFNIYSLFVDFISFLPIYNQLSNKTLPIQQSVIPNWK